MLGPETMRNAATLLLVTMSLSTQIGCETSCGERKAPLLWSEGIVTETNGLRSYETTPIDGTWLHFPSYRRFKLPHGFGTKGLSIDAYVSLADDAPASEDDGPSKFAIASSGEVLATLLDDNNVIVENATCENGYYLYVQITEKGAVPAEADR